MLEVQMSSYFKKICDKILICCMFWLRCFIFYIVSNRSIHKWRAHERKDQHPFITRLRDKTVLNYENFQMHMAFFIHRFSIQISKCLKWLWWHTYEFMKVFFIMCSPLVLRGYADCFYLLGWKRRAMSGLQIHSTSKQSLTLSLATFEKLAGTLYPDLRQW